MNSNQDLNKKIEKYKAILLKETGLSEKELEEFRQKIIKKNDGKISELGSYFVVAFNYSVNLKKGMNYYD